MKSGISLYNQKLITGDENIMLRKTLEKISIENFDLDIVFDSNEQYSTPVKGKPARKKKKPAARNGARRKIIKKRIIQN